MYYEFRLLRAKSRPAGFGQLSLLSRYRIEIEIVQVSGDGTPSSVAYGATFPFEGEAIVQTSSALL